MMQQFIIGMFVGGFVGLISLGLAIKLYLK